MKKARAFRPLAEPCPPKPGAGGRPHGLADPSNPFFRAGFTLVEVLVTTVVMVIVFSLLAVIFGRATTIHQVVRRGGDAENLGVYLVNTILFGPGIDREQGLIGAREVYLPSQDVIYDGFTPTLADDEDWRTTVLGDPDPVRYLYLAFQPPDQNGTPLDPVVYRLSVTAGEPLSVRRSRGGYDFTDENDYYDLTPGWAKEQQLEILPGSYFGFYRDLTSSGPVPATEATQVRYVLVYLELKSALQPEGEKVILRRFVRVRNNLGLPANF